MNTLKYLAAIAAAMALSPAISHAEIAYTAKDVHLRAGPARDYPVVAILAAGSEIFVEGCLSDYSWCDVVAGANRGWVYAGNISYPYQGDSVPLLTYGNTIGIGIVTFSLGAYWDYYYRGRPWYSQRRQWIDRPRPPVRRGDVHRPGPPAGGLHPPVARPPQQGHGTGPDRGRPSPRPPISRPHPTNPTPPPPAHSPGGTRPPQDRAPGGGSRPPGDHKPGGH